MNFLLIFVFFCFFKSCRSIVTIEDNGYKGVVVAIHNSVQDDVEMIRNIKDLFTSASDVLYKVTRNRATFQEVTIIVPSNWTARPDYETTNGGNQFFTADVRIDAANPDYGNTPYAMQSSSCGKPGQFIHLTPEFVKNLHDETQNQFGDPGKVFIHEWAHYRYGIFDEYADPSDPSTRAFYLDDENQIRPTGCSANISGWLADEGSPCHVGPDGLPDENCVFYPDTQTQNSATKRKPHSSLMYLHYYPIMEGFCDDTEELKHNTAAPNKQNILCGGRSTWEVVSRHEDFLQDQNPPKRDLRTTPKFRILQPLKDVGKHYVLLLDVSGSMTGRRIDMLHRAASIFIKHQIPDKSRLGIVTFSTVPRIAAQITEVTESSRSTLASYLPTVDDEGNTAIGDGLLTALELLKSKKATEGATIILISDGEENVHPFIAKVLPQILESKVVINTIAFGSLASKHLEKLVRVTGGHGFFYSDEDIEAKQIGNLQAAFFAAASTQADVDLQPVELNNRLLPTPTNGESKGRIVVDESIGRNTQFVFTTSFPTELELTLTSPSKKIYDESSKEFKDDSYSGSKSFIFKMAEKGIWEYKIKNHYQTEQKVDVSVTSEPKDIRKQPIRIRAWISDVAFNYPIDASEAKIFAEVKKKYTPIVRATVVASVERPIGDYVEVELFDNGAGADITKNDGIYSAYFTKFNGSGRYSVSARVLNNGKAKIRVKKVGKRKKGVLEVEKYIGNQKPNFHFDPSDFKPAEELVTVSRFEESSVDPFERSQMAGSFNLEGWKSEMAQDDLIPPNRVIDLEANAVSLVNKTYHLSWTSPGDDMDQGTANKTEIRFHTRQKLFFDEFTRANLITEDHVVDGNLTPPAGGSRQELTIKLKEFHEDNLVGSPMYFALKSYDDANNVGKMSNVASAHFSRPKAQSIPASQITLFVVIAIVALVVIMVVIIVAARLQQRQQQHGSKEFV